MSNLVLVDDSTTIQKIVELAFAAEDVDVHSFVDAGEALDHLVLKGADVVLADITLPGLDGYELCRRIRLSPKLCDVPVVLLAGTFEPFDVQRAEESGYSSSLTKPFEANQLVNLVHDLLKPRPDGSGAPVSPVAAGVPPELFEIPVGTAAQPLFELRRDQCRPGPATLGRAPGQVADDAQTAELEAVTGEVLRRVSTELERLLPRIVRQVLRDRR